MLNKWKKLMAGLLCIGGAALLSCPVCAAAVPADAGMQPEQSAAADFMDDLVEAAAYKGAKQSEILPAPGTLEAAKTTYNSSTLNWSQVAGAEGYRIEYTVDGAGYTTAATVDKNARSYKCRKLLTGTEYKFRVCAVDERGRAGNYALVTVQPALKKTKITGAEVKMHAVTLEWKKVSGAESYQLYRRTKDGDDYEQAAATSQPSYTDEDVAAGGTYWYRVCAVRKVNGETVKAKLSAAYKIAVEMPAIQLEACEAVDYRSIKLAWQQADSASGYYIYRSTKENGTYKKIKTIKKNTTLTYTDTGVVPGKTFYYKVCAYTQEPGKTAAAGEQSAYMSAETQMDAPQLTAVKASAGNRSIEVSWSSMAGATGYRVYRSVNAKKKFVQIAQLEGSTSTGYEDGAVAPGGTYYYRIKALYKNEKYSGVSQVSSVMQADAAPAAPIGLSIRQTATDVLEVSWQESAGAKSYNLYRADAGDADYTCIAKGIRTSRYTDSGLLSDKNYYYRVSASGEAGEGLACLPVNFLVGGVSINTRTLKLCAGVSKRLEISTYRQGRVVWKSADSKIAEVDSDGRVTGISSGTVKITAAAAGKSASVTVTVTPGNRNGIDVSRQQGDVDWQRVKDSGVQFAFLRISDHDQADCTFETNYQNAALAGMPVGVCCHSQATTVAEAQKEAQTVLKILNGRKLAYPIAFEIGDAVQRADGMTEETMHQMILAFKQAAEDGGYRFVLASHLSFLNSNLNKTSLEGIDLWIARYRDLSLGTGYAGSGSLRYWQYNNGQYEGSDCYVDGITDAAGNLMPAGVNIEY